MEGPCRESRAQLQGPRHSPRPRPAAHASTHSYTEPSAIWAIRSEPRPPSPSEHGAIADLRVSLSSSPFVFSRGSGPWGPGPWGKAPVPRELLERIRESPAKRSQPRNVRVDQLPDASGGPGEPREDPERARPHSGQAPCLTPPNSLETRPRSLWTLIFVLLDRDLSRNHSYSYYLTEIFVETVHIHTT